MNMLQLAVIASTLKVFSGRVCSDLGPDTVRLIRRGPMTAVRPEDSDRILLEKKKLENQNLNLFFLLLFFLQKRRKKWFFEFDFFFILFLQHFPNSY